MTILALMVGVAIAQAAPSSKKIEIVSATDPVPSGANAPAAKDIPASAPPPGKNSFRLIGVSEFNLPAHRDHVVIIKGLLIKGSPVSRLNMTSVTTIAAACAAAAK